MPANFIQEPTTPKWPKMQLQRTLNLFRIILALGHNDRRKISVISDCHSSISISPLNFKSSGISRKLRAGVWMAKVFSPIRQRQVISDKLKCSLFLSFVPKIDNVPNSISPPAWEPVCSSSILQFSHLPPLANRALAAPLRTQEALSMAGS